MANLKEKWLPIPHSPNYSVSTFGNVKSLKTGRIMKMFKRYQKGKKNAITIVLSTGTFLVHRLVMAAFKPNSDPSLTVDHKDRNPFNNYLNNLRWATKAEQIKNSVCTRRKQRMKITVKDLHIVYRRSKTEMLTEIAKDYDINPKHLGLMLIYLHPDY